MRVIFLDIDGVVNTLQIYKEPPAHIPKEQLKLVEGYYVLQVKKGLAIFKQ